MLICEGPPFPHLSANRHLNCGRPSLQNAVLHSHGNACRLWPMLNGCAGCGLC